MVSVASIPTIAAAAAPFSALPPLSRPDHLLSFRWPPSSCRLHLRLRLRRCRDSSARIYAVEPNSSPSGPREYQQQQPPRTLFPGGFKRPEIRVPTLALRLSAEEVLDAEGSATAAADIDVALSSGVGMVVLECGSGSGGARLYEAARALNSLVGDRAYLLITERVDVAAAVGASGVVLSDEAIPTLIARNMMMSAKSNSIYLPLVARTVQNINSAINASTSEGADFLIMSVNTGNWADIVENSVVGYVKVPIFFSVGDQSPLSVVSKLLESGACGVVMSMSDLKCVSKNHGKDFWFKAYGANHVMPDKYFNFTKVKTTGTSVINDKNRVTGFTKLDEQEIQLIEAEKLLIDEAVSVIQKASPMMKEVSLLMDAASRLTEPFLLVVVGEFNSGKSTVINALLGRKYLKEGVVPTTNEITLLRYSEIDSGNYNRCERIPDGQFICYLSAPILKEINLVDTPGTNVILRRQQSLTEEFVPRADLLLFVISADRPLTESEVGFLLYVQQWKKRVVFVLNKLDMYRSSSELEEAIAFVRSNASKLLNTEDIKLFTVSARSALDAKLSSLNDGSKFEELLLADPRWLSSRFFELEEFLYSFLDGSTEMGMERVKLKLESPLGIADRLLSSCEMLVKQEYENANQDLESIEQVRNSITDYATKIESESITWQKQALSSLKAAKTRTLKLMESVLQLSNTNLISTYAFRGEKSTSLTATSAVQNEILDPALSDALRLVGEYSLWLDSKNAQAAKLYTEQFDRNWQALGGMQNAVCTDIYCVVGRDENLSYRVLQNFSASAAARQFEQEIREVVLGTFGGLGAAGLSASLLTSVLPTTLEDLLALALCSAGGYEVSDSSDLVSLGSVNSFLAKVVPNDYGSIRPSCG